MQTIDHPQSLRETTFAPHAAAPPPHRTFAVLSRLCSVLDYVESGMDAFEVDGYGANRARGEPHPNVYVTHPSVQDVDDSDTEWLDDDAHWEFGAPLSIHLLEEEPPLTPSWWDELFGPDVVLLERRDWSVERVRPAASDEPERVSQGSEAEHSASSALDEVLQDRPATGDEVIGASLPAVSEATGTQPQAVASRRVSPLVLLRQLLARRGEEDPTFQTDDVELLLPGVHVVVKTHATLRGGGHVPLIPGVSEHTFGARVVLSIDTEYVEVHDEDSRPRNRIVSYQVAALDDRGNYLEVILYPARDQRLTLPQIIELVRKRLGLRPAHLRAKLNNNGRLDGRSRGAGVVVIWHFGAAEWSSLLDRDELAEHLTLIQKVPVTLGAVAYPMRMSNRLETIALRVVDTTLLAPEGQKSLAALGEVVGIDKVQLPPGAIKDMEGLLARDRELFETYAITDCRIALAYWQRLQALVREEFDLAELPLTVGALSVATYIKHVGEAQYLRDMGLQKVRRYRKTTTEPSALREQTESFCGAAFMGGRNYAVPSSLRGRLLLDLDFMSAYPSAMAFQPAIDWHNYLPQNEAEPLDIGRYTTETGFATAMAVHYVDFRFPDGCRRPCIPVSAGSRGIIFPLRGRGYATAPELELALAKGAEVRILTKQAFPIQRDELGRARLVFAPFLAEMVARRGQFPKKSLENLFYKLIANSYYGKLAQGVRPRNTRAFGQDGQLEPSRVTNPVHAAVTTGLVRAALISLEDACESVGGEVVSATTDGATVAFDVGPELLDRLIRLPRERYQDALDAVPGLRAAIEQAPPVRNLLQGRVNMGQPPEIIEVKAIGDYAEIFKTRGYVLMNKSRDPGDQVVHVGRAGMRVTAEEMIDFGRNADEIPSWTLTRLTSAQAIYDGKALDLVQITSTRKVNLDFDLKLIPRGDGTLRPPSTLEEFTDFRESAENLRRQGTPATIDRVLLAQAGVQQRGGDEAAVARMWLRALLKGVGGLPIPTLTGQEIAERLGIDVMDIKNARRSGRPFLPLPHTPRTVAALEAMLDRLGLAVPDSLQNPLKHPALFSRV